MQAELVRPTFVCNLTVLTMTIFVQLTVGLICTQWLSSFQRTRNRSPLLSMWEPLIIYRFLPVVAGIATSRMA